VSKGITWFRVTQVNDWSKLEDLLESYYVDQALNAGNRWIFRGVSSVSYGLLNSLERELRGNPYWEGKPAEAERLLIHEFKKRAHHYVRDVPRETAEIEWLALMQHHGAPTRLLDWTRSPYVALFFAVRGSSANLGNPAIWVLNIEYCTRVACRVLQEQLCLKQPPSDHQLFDLCCDKAFDVVFPIDPMRANERLAIQQGVLLYPGNIGKSFDENLSGGVGMDDMVRIEIDRELIPIAMYHLHMMNISHATLFPGMDGFSVSMKELLWIPEHVRPESASR